MKRPGKVGVILLGVLLLAVLASLVRTRMANRTGQTELDASASVTPPRSAASASTPLLSREEESGRLVYERYCIFCHGTGGDGFGINASNLRLQPPTLADERRLSKEIDQHVADRIAGGGMARGLPAGCPPWERRLGTGNIQAVVAYLRWLGRRRI